MRLPILLAIGSLLTACYTGSRQTDGDASLPIPEVAARSDRPGRRVAVLSSIPTKRGVLILLPDSARVGQTISAQINTAGACGIGSDTTVVTINKLNATIVPYQSVLQIPPNVECSPSITMRERSISLTFRVAGRAHVELLYRDSAQTERRTLRHAIEIRAMNSGGGA
jgi:hypothetical protein